VKTTFGISSLALFSAIALGSAFIAGCAEEGPAPDAKPASPPAAVAPAKTGGESKPAAPAASPAKPEEAKK